MTGTRDVLNDAVVAMIVASTGKEVGLGKLPSLASGDSLHPPMPYAVVFPFHAVGDSGSFKDPAEDMDYLFQVTCAGIDERQCAWMSSKVEAGFMTRGTIDNGFLWPITAAGWNILWRLHDSLGAIIPSGEDLYISQDTYRVRAGS